jgi:hypothetical protein
LEVGVVFAELALLFLSEGRTVRELVADCPRLGLFFASSSSSSRVRRSIDWILISVLMWFTDGLRETLGQSARRFSVRTVRGSITDSPIIQGAALLVRSAFSDSPRVVTGRSATPSRPVRRSHTDSPPRLLQFRACALFLVCLLQLLVPRLLGGSFEFV